MTWVNSWLRVCNQELTGKYPEVLVATLISLIIDSTNSTKLGSNNESVPTTN